MKELGWQRMEKVNTDYKRRIEAQFSNMHKT